MSFPDVDGYNDNLADNIDIEFWGIYYVDIAEIMDKIEITEVKSSIPYKFKKMILETKARLFKISSKEEIYFIVASGFLVGTNIWTTEDRILNSTLEYDKVMYKSG